MQEWSLRMPMVGSKVGGEFFLESVRALKKKFETIHLKALCCITSALNGGRSTLSRQLDATIDPATNQRRPRDVIRHVFKLTNCRPITDNCRQSSGIRHVKKLWREKQRQGVFWRLDPYLTLALQWLICTFPYKDQYVFQKKGDENREVYSLRDSVLITTFSKLTSWEWQG